MKRCFILLLILSASKFSLSQNLFDFSHSLKYAQYLQKSAQYNLAIEEYERLLFFKPFSDSIKLQLITSYRLSNRYQEGIQRFEQIFSKEIANYTHEIAKEYLKLNQLAQKYEIVDTFLNSCNILPEYEKKFFHTSNLLLKRGWPEFKQNILLDSSMASTFSELIPSINSIKYKKKAIAICLSTILPGAGKIYTGNWKDAIFSFIFVGTNFLQAFRGFKRNGTESIYGWVFASFTAGFYLGNIYGSYKACKRHNKQIDEKILKNAKDCIISYY